MHRGNVRSSLNRRRPHNTWCGGHQRRRGHHKDSRGAKGTIGRKKIRRGMGPNCAVRIVHAGRVARSLGLLGNLFCPMLNLMENRTSHPTRNKRHEQEPGQYGTASGHKWKRG